MTRPTRVRHVVLWLTVAAYMITYMDRVMISTAVPWIRKDLGFSMVTIGLIMSAFRTGYSLFQIPGGWLGDRIGPRRALTLIVTWWSLFTSLTGSAWNLSSMLVVRFLFGVGEAGAFPIATRSLSRWMLPSERGYAQSITHAGSRLAGALTPPLVVVMILAFGWRLVFVWFGALGIVWAAVWHWYYRDRPSEHSGVNAAERDLIRSALGEEHPRISKPVPWRLILRSSNLWTVCAMYFCYGYCFAMYQEWLPTYLNAHRGFSLTKMGIFASLPMLAGTAGDAIGGTLSDWLARSRMTLTRSRRVVAMGGFLMATAGILPATLTASPEMSVLYTCVAVFGLEITIGVSWAIPLDIGGDYAGSVSAVMNTCGNIGGTISPALLAYLVGAYGWDVPFFVAAAMCVAAALLHLKIDAARPIQLAPERGEA
jgi:MFS transporter, ACS family, glucarate transporter